MKERTDKLDFIKIKIFSPKKNTVKRKKRQVTDWEKIFARHMIKKFYLTFAKEPLKTQQ